MIESTDIDGVRGLAIKDSKKIAGKAYLVAFKEGKYGTMYESMGAEFILKRLAAFNPVIIECYVKGKQVAL